jgi:YD repeat-containing protein
VTGSYGQWYGTTCWGFPSGSRGVGFVTVAALTGGTRPIPPSISWKDTYCAACAAAGRPVNAMTGHQWTSATDLAVAARGLPLVVGRTYNSYDGYDALDSPFGYGWSWGYGARALTHADGSVTIVDPNGKRLRFWKTGASWTAGPAVNATLAAAGGGYTLTRHDQTVWTFNAAGQLVSMADRSGNTQTLSYAGTNLASVSAPGGRTLTITTNAQGHITAISGPASLATSYTYDASGNLATATDAAGAVTTYTYDSRHQLLTVKDGNTHTVETNTYGTLGRVSQQVDAAGQTTTFKYLAEQGTTGSLGTNEVVDPRGSRRSTPTTGPGG